MKKTLIGGGSAAPILLLTIAMIISCDSSKPDQDADATEHDGDIVADKEDSLVDQDEIVVESEVMPDDTVLVPDSDLDTDCSPLIEAQFPFYKDDGTIHFCRPGCDTPTEKDPQCVTNLWKEANLKLATDHPEADCYPYPCEMSNLKPMTKEEVESQFTTIPMHECDLKLGSAGWDTDSTSGQIKHWNLSGGKAGFVMYKVSLDNRVYPTFKRYFTYDPATKKYTVQSPGDYGFVYHQGSALLYFRDARSHELSGNHYIGYFSSNGAYRVVYPQPALYIIYTPTLNEKWIFANIQETQNGPTKMMYAKVGEWKWTALGTGVAYYPDLKGDLLSFYDSTEKGFLCDLSKKPASVDSCRKVNREGEVARDIVFDKENDGIAAYTNTNKVFLLRYDKDPIEYTELFSDYTGKSDQFLGFIVNMLRGDMLMYTEAYFYGGSTYGGRLCFYRLDTKQRSCMNKMDKDKLYGEDVVYPYGDAEFEGDHVLYQQLNSSPLILRDMKCYCEKEGVCPFEGMK